MQILIADDHILIRAGLKQLVEANEGCEVIAEASTGSETVNRLEQHDIDVLLLDISMPDGNGLEILKVIRKRWPDLRILMLSMHSDIAHVKTALQNGANGFLVKDSAPAELCIAVETVMNGQKYLSPRISDCLVDAWMEPDKANEQVRLSPRQQEILDLIAQGFSNKEIASRLDLSVKTIETHRSRMMEALGLNRGNELLRYALRNSRPSQFEIN